MPTDFTQDFEDGDIIYALHVNQIFQPIQDLETGKAIYRAAVLGQDSHYEVDFTASANPGGSSLSTLTPGQVIVFKASHTSLAGKNLTVLTDEGEQSYPLYISGQPINDGDISGFQIVAVVYNDASSEYETLPPRFDVIGSSTGEGSSVSSLEDLDDVELSLPTQGEILQFNSSGNAINIDLSSAGIATTSDISDLQTQVNGKQPQASQLSQISSQVMSKGDIFVHDGTGVTKLSTGTDGQVLQANSSASTGLEWSSPSVGSQGPPGEQGPQGPAGPPGPNGPLGDLSDVTITTPSSGQFVRFNGTNFVNANLSAGDVPSGVDASKIGSGTVSNTEFGYLDGVTSSIQTQLDGKASSSHTHAAGDITSGTLPVVRGGTGANLSSTGGTGQVLKQTAAGGAVSVGALTSGEMPNGIDAAKIGSGAVGNAEFGYLDGVTSSIQTQLNNKAASIHTHSADDITSGTLPIARGGTGSGTASSARTNLDVPSNSDLTSGLATKQDTSEKGQAGGYASLDSNSKVPLNQIPSHTHSVSEGGTGLTSLGAANRLLYSTSASALATLAAGANGQILYMGASAPYWGNPPTSGVTGSGVNTRLALWSGSSSITSNSSLYLSGSNLYASSFTSSTGSYYSATGATYLRNLQNQGFTTTLYWDPSSKQVGYLYSRAAHKKNVKTIESSIEDLMKWRPVTFEWKEAFGGQPDLGLISEEVDSVFPLAATYDEDWEYTDEETGEYARDEEHGPKKIEGTMVPAGVKYERAWLPMLAAVQDFYRKYQTLEKRVEELEASGGAQK